MGKKLIFLPSCHSTNEEAAALASAADSYDGTLLITNNQTAGKGQRGNSWEAEAGKNLTFSLIMKPTFLMANQQFYLNMAVSLGLIDYLNHTQTGFEVKWPNDIYYNDMKIAGILIQNTLKGSFIENAVIGIGLNINQTAFHHPKATSLQVISKADWSLTETLENICLSIEKRYLQLKHSQLQLLRDDYLNNMYQFGCDCIYQDAKGPFAGRIVGVSPRGQLEIETHKGLRSFDFKEVTFI